MCCVLLIDIDSIKTTSYNYCVIVAICLYYAASFVWALCYVVVLVVLLITFIDMHIFSREIIADITKRIAALVSRFTVPSQPA